MVNAARKKMLYKELIVQSVAEYFSGSGSSFDLVVAADLFAYMGDLEATFAQVCKVLRPKALFVFTVEAFEPEDPPVAFKGFRLLPSGRFGHSKSYIEAAVSKAMGSSCSIIK